MYSLLIHVVQSHWMIRFQGEHRSRRSHLRLQNNSDLLRFKLVISVFFFSPPFKAMHSVLQLLLLLLITTVTISIPVFAENDSIYDVLRAHALPMGLLPKGVKEFNVDVETGHFSVFLNQSCKAKYESEIHYEANITGTIGYGSIGGLTGVSAQDLFLWFPVKGIRVDIPSSGVIYFDVGVVRKRYPMSLFETPRDCVAVVEKVWTLVLPSLNLLSAL